MPDHQKGLVALYATIFLLATNGIFAKTLPLSSIDTTLYRACVAAAVLLPIAAWQKVSLRLRGAREISTMTVLGVLLIAHWVTFFEAMRVSTVAIGMTALYTYPVFTVLVEAVVSRKPISRQDMLVAACVFTGIYIISPLHAGSSDALLGIGWGIVSALSFALRNVAQRRLLRHRSPICSVLYQTFAGALVLIPFASAAPASIGPNDMLSLALLGVLFTAVPHTLLAVSLRHLRAKTVAFIGCLQPVLGALMALVVIGERPAWNVLVGAVFVLGGVVYETARSGAETKSPAPPGKAAPASTTTVGN